jgi:hypothetical protein
VNLAISTIILFITFIFPSMVFRKFYYSGEFSQQYFKSNPFQLFMAAIIPGIVFQIFFYYFFTQVLRIDLDIQNFVALFYKSDFSEMVAAFNAFHFNIVKIIAYHFSLWFVVGLIGFFCKVFIRTLKLDRKFEFFRFQNFWHYLLMGEILDFYGYSGNSDDIHFTMVDVLLKIDNSATLIYSGILNGYHLTKESGGLDYIYLTYVKKRQWDENCNLEWVPVPGDYFVVPFADVLNINITYYYYTEDPEDE